MEEIVSCAHPVTGNKLPREEEYVGVVRRGMVAFKKPSEFFKSHKYSCWIWPLHDNTPVIGLPRSSRCTTGTLPDIRIIEWEARIVSCVSVRFAQSWLGRRKANTWDKKHSDTNHITSHFNYLLWCNFNFSFPRVKIIVRCQCSEAARPPPPPGPRSPWSRLDRLRLARHY